MGAEVEVRELIKRYPKRDVNAVDELSFSVEPGIYFMGDFGIRSEINVYITKDRKVVVPGEPRQQELVAILK